MLHRFLLIFCVLAWAAPGAAAERAVGQRLVASRLALGLKAVDICKTINVQQNTYSQWESGDRLIGPSDSIRLCDRFGLTLDWIYQGDMAGLPHSLATKLLERAS